MLGVGELQVQNLDTPLTVLRVWLCRSLSSWPRVPRKAAGLDTDLLSWRKSKGTRSCEEWRAGKM